MEHSVHPHGAAARTDAQAHHACRVRFSARRAASTRARSHAPSHAISGAWLLCLRFLAPLPWRSGVDVSPIVWVALLSFMNEILLGKQGLLILLASKQLA